MINYEVYQLENGLELIVHEDPSTPLVAVNILYKVGSRNEHSDKTGFAHLFEHLMFSGSKNVEDFDIPLQMAGGENNAFTNADITNFYNLVPRENLETVLWLESDRMAYLDINQESLDTQKKVVVEEFKEVCLNQPYGDMWHHLSELAYKVHPYKWPTIGKDFSHIEQAKLEQVQSFYDMYYNPSNAIVTIAGNIKSEEIHELVKKYFGWIENKPEAVINSPTEIPREPQQVNAQIKKIESLVPAVSIYMGFHMEDRKSQEYYIADLITDVLANGRSSRFYQNLYKDTNYFSTIDAYISGTFDPGLLIVEAKLNDGVNIEDAKKAVWTELNRIKEELISEDELQKLLNKIESAQIYSEINILNKAINLAYYACLGDINLINSQAQKYQSVTIHDIQKISQKLLVPENCSEIIYEPPVNAVV